MQKEETAGKTVNLTTEEKDHLMIIYNARLRVFVTTYIPILIIALIFCFKIDYRDKYDRKPRIWNKKENGDGVVDRGGMVAINILFLETPLLIMGLVLYRRRIKAFKKDAENGAKEMVPYEIVRKTYFPQTGQHFISFNDPKYMHHEVDAYFYSNCNEGDVAYIGRAPLSKYVFDRNGRFSLM